LDLQARNKENLVKELSVQPKIDAEYLFKIIKRNSFPAIIVMIFILILTGIAVTFSRDFYRSTVVADFNRNDVTSLATQSAAALGIDRSDSSFGSRFSDPSFLKSLADKAGVRTQGRMDKLLVEMNLRAPQGEADRGSQLVGYFSKRLIPSVNSGTGYLNLEVRLDDTPEKSQELAALAMEEFITLELSGLASRLGIKIDTLSAALKRSQAHLVTLKQQLKEGPADVNESEDLTVFPAADGLEANSLLSLRKRETDLQDQIRATEREFASLIDDQARRRVLLESEFQRLSSRLAPYHPDMIAKQSELKSMNESNGLVEKSARQLSRLRREILLLRTESALPGLGGLPEDPLGTVEARIEANQIATLQQAITELEIERDSLVRQASDPALRTRIKVIRPATYDLKPASRKKLQVGVAGVILAIMAGVAVMFYREARSPLVRDAWRVARFTGLPVLAQMSSKSFKTFTRIGADQADMMRSKLGSRSIVDRPFIRALLAYRKVGLALFRSSQGKVVFILAAGPDDLSSDFVFNLANIVATDTGRKVLVVDGNPSEPVVTMPQANMPDFIDSLLGVVTPSSIVVKALGARAFDVIAVTKPIIGVRTRAIQEATVARFFAELEPLYDLVLVRSLPETHFIENLTITSAATDVIFGVDAEHTTFADLARSLDQVGRSKLRGLFLVGS
jgi:hypothetical protein